jgi:hypothetical protein
MKKLLLALCLVPGVICAQSLAPLKNKPQPVKVNALKIQDVTPPSPARVQTPAPHASLKKSGGDTTYKIPAIKIGETTYDLQTNNAIARRVVLYPNGQVSAVWTHAADVSPDFIDRGSSYAHFDGTRWSNYNKVRLEDDRAGWPNLATYNDNGTMKEFIVSHYAQAGTTTLSGGTFWLHNNSVGDSVFTQLFAENKPNGPLWPRMGITGDYVHVIAVYNNNKRIHGIRNPVVYYRYNLKTSTFEVRGDLIPGYDSTRYGMGSADQYSIDTRDSIVAVVISGAANDVTLFKSMDYGKTWNRTIVDSSPVAPYDFENDTEFDTLYSNDGRATVTIDKQGTAHVFFPRLKIINTIAGDSAYSYFADNSGIFHWDDKNKTKAVAGYVIDYDGDGQLNIASGTNDRSYASYNGNNLASFPIGAVDDNNNIYMVYSAPLENDLSADQTSNFRDIYVNHSTDGGLTWNTPQDITANLDLEDVFATVARDCDSKLHVVWMQDETPGIYLVNTTTISTNSIMYEGVPVEDILQSKIGLHDVGIQKVQNENNIFSVGQIFPNPNNGQFELPIVMTKAANTNVRIVDMVGKVISEQNSGVIGEGKTVLNMDISSLAPGVYFCQVTAGGVTSSQKLVIGQ